MPIIAEERIELLKWIMSLDENSAAYKEIRQLKNEAENHNEKQPQ